MNKKLMVVKMEGESDFGVKIDGSTFEVVSEFVYLSVVIDESDDYRKAVENCG